jgi:probable rRNA maturation factor
MSLDPPPIEAVARRILVDHDYPSAEISIAVVDDASIRVLNRNYLNHDYETDVLSFVLDRDPAAGWLNGEVIASATTAKRVAPEHDVSPTDELLLYIIHGMLHLVGLDDKSRSQRIRMRDSEKHYADWLGISYVMPAELESEDGAD